jgi:hypothetical protein
MQSGNLMMKFCGQVAIKAIGHLVSSLEIIFFGKAGKLHGGHLFESHFIDA